mmetsp:Transcript_33141/g.98666  ORF Transcript_33141/g.98666 Transcript_33141/m.98666 type:complete len:579 (-) Transcript_33141:319-2055(-)
MQLLHLNLQRGDGSLPERVSDAFLLRGPVRGRQTRTAAILVHAGATEHGQTREILALAALEVHPGLALAPQEAIAGLVEGEAPALDGKHLGTAKADHEEGVEVPVGAHGHAVLLLLCSSPEFLLASLVRPHVRVRQADGGERGGARRLDGAALARHSENVVDAASSHGQGDLVPGILMDRPVEPAHRLVLKLAVRNAVHQDHGRAQQSLPRPATAVEAIVAHLHAAARQRVDHPDVLLGNAEELVVEAHHLHVVVQHAFVLGVALAHLRTDLWLGMEVNVVVPTGQGDVDHAVVTHAQASPVALGLHHQSWEPAREGHDVDALAVVAVEGPMRDGIDRVGVGQQVWLCHWDLASLLLTEDPSLHCHLPPFGQVGVVHQIMSEEHHLALPAGDDDVVRLPVWRMQRQSATTAAHKVDHADLSPPVEGEVSLNYARPHSIAPRVVEEIQLLLGVGAVHVQHPVAPADALESQVRRNIADTEGQVCELLVSRVEAGARLDVNVLLQCGIVGDIPLHPLAVRALAHVHGLELRHKASPVVELLQLLGGCFSVPRFEGHLHDAILLVFQRSGNVRLELRSAGL